jgi:predicted AAA+ superfamily ATPase
MSQKTPAELGAELDEARSSFNVLFESSRSGDAGIIEMDNGADAACLRDAVDLVIADLAELIDNPVSSRRILSRISHSHDSIDCLNSLADSCEKSVVDNIERIILEVFDLRGMFSEQMELKERDFLIRHAIRLTNLPQIFKLYIALLRDGVSDTALERLSPIVDKKLEKNTVFTLGEDGMVSPQIIETLKVRVSETDLFSQDRAFRFFDNIFVPANLTTIREVKGFYGYSEVRRVFDEHFRDFASGKSNLPLLISSLPGLGKTHFSIAFAMAQEKLTLILPEPEDLEHTLEILFKRLAGRRSRKFVLFFDDVDTRSVDWYFFRTNVGGSYMLPPNVNVVIASNYRFPANISSRGRGVTFPMFDEITCQDMVADFLRSMGMTKPPADLVSVVAADYVAEFGQKKFEELSPRTLIRYLERYRKSAEKRQKSLELSREEMVSQPDAQVFFKFNVKIIRNLYGEEGIEELKQRQLDMEID